MCAPDAVEEIAELMMKEFSKCKEEGSLNMEIEAAKRKLITKRVLNLENVAEHLKFLGKCAVYGNIFSIEQEIRIIRRIGEQAVKEVIQCIFKDSNMACAAIGNT